MDKRKKLDKISEKIREDFLMFAKVSEQMNFYGDLSPIELVEKYGSPLYVYNENILRERCKEIKNLVKYPNFKVHYSAKANSNLSLLKINQR